MLINTANMYRAATVGQKLLDALNMGALLCPPHNPGSWVSPGKQRGLPQGGPMLPAPFARRLCHVFPGGPGMHCGRKAALHPPPPPSTVNSSLYPRVLALPRSQCHSDPQAPHIHLMNQRDVKNEGQLPSRLDHHQETDGRKR